MNSRSDCRAPSAACSSWEDLESGLVLRAAGRPPVSWSSFPSAPHKFSRALSSHGLWEGPATVLRYRVESQVGLARPTSVQGRVGCSWAA